MGKLLQPLQTLQSLLGKPLNKATLRKEVSGCCRKVGHYEIVGVWRGMVGPINACYYKASKEVTHFVSKLET